uniref:non-specific serine/threonine protein kinase n=1 Tax=Plectus sambesii TaxID=2011161 RepID=A0A914WKZ2_9BILA
MLAFVASASTARNSPRSPPPPRKYGVCYLVDGSLRSTSKSSSSDKNGRVTSGARSCDDRARCGQQSSTASGGGGRQPRSAVAAAGGALRGSSPAHSSRRHTELRILVKPVSGTNAELPPAPKSQRQKPQQLDEKQAQQQLQQQEHESADRGRGSRRERRDSIPSSRSFPGTALLIVTDDDAERTNGSALSSPRTPPPPPKTPDSPWQRFPSMLRRAWESGQSQSRSGSPTPAHTPLSPRASYESSVAASSARPGEKQLTVGRSISCYTMGERGFRLSPPPEIILTHLMQLKKELRPVNQRNNRGLRRSFNASTSPVLPPRCRSPGRSLLGGKTAPLLPGGGGPSTSSAAAGGAVMHGRSHSTRSGSSLMAPSHGDTRRWSVASLPSSSGYGTPGSNSAFSSQYSSQEHLAEMMGDLRMGAHFDSNDSCPSNEDCGFRPRSRSLNSPVKFGSDSANDVSIRSNVYKERFPKAKSQMEEKLTAFIEENGPLSGGTTVSSTAVSGDTSPAAKRLSRMESVETSGSLGDAVVMRLIADGATRFLHHQIVEMAADCLNRSREDLITSIYFCDMSQRLEDTLIEAHEKTSPESYAYLSKLVKQLLMIVSRPARLLECLEFDPDEFYQLLEEAEGAVREQLGSGTARVPDLPQYIVSKLGLDRDPLMDTTDTSAAGPSDPANPFDYTDGNDKTLHASSFDGYITDDKPKSAWPESRPPCEDDFETIRLVSNGAYGAVYLVRHRETRQRFALKKMSKQSLMLRNQIDQVYAERDILTFTDNPFVVSFYGSFETKHHLCMLMEYVEGGDCAALLKNAGTLPADLTRLYIAETVLAIEYLHSYGIVHRDMKPDNLLITAMGHIKLTDFGLSKIGLMNRTTLVYEGGLDVADTQQFKDKQLCGTPEYIAPEVILRQGYGKPVDWWALGVILYEFLVGIVPFIGNTPEELFANVISEDIVFPTDEEAMSEEAEDLVRHLLEKNPLERLGTLNGAAEVSVHPFFKGLDFNSLLRQKAEFVPRLENEEDTSYFDTRADRYNHDAESGEEESSTPMFWSFSTASPRHSIVGIDAQHLPMPGAADPLARKASAQSEESAESGFGGHHSADSDVEIRYGNEPIPTAVLLRRRFSAQRQTNFSTSSSGTGTPGVNTNFSSTDSSIDASSSTSAPMGGSGCLGEELHQAPRRRTHTAPSPLPRFAISCDPDEGGSSSVHASHHLHPDNVSKELSPVDERLTPIELDEEDHRLRFTSVGADFAASTSNVTMRNRERPSGGGRKVVAPSPMQKALTVATSGIIGHGNRHNPALHLVIPTASPPPSSNSSQLSPGGCSASSASSVDMPTPKDNLTALSLQSSGSGADLSPQILGQPLNAPIIIRKGPRGFGFTIRSVRVYLGEDSDYYTIQHMVTQVDENSPAYEGGLRQDDLITHVHGEPVQNLTHPQLMHRLLSFGNELNLKVTPIANTSIKEGAARRSVGKLAKKKTKRPQRRAPLEKKPRKPPSLLRRLSGKRTSTEIAPGTSLQKQTFIPRSVSSQDGVGAQPGATGGTNMQVPAVQHKRLSDVGLRSDDPALAVGPQTSPLVLAAAATASANRPSTLQGLKHKVQGMAQHLTPGGRKHQNTAPMPVSPLARQDSVPSSSASTVPSTACASLSPSRSPSPLAMQTQVNTTGSATASTVKRTVTQPRKSDVGLVSLTTAPSSQLSSDKVGRPDRKLSVPVPQPPPRK